MWRAREDATVMWIAAARRMSSIFAGRGCLSLDGVVHGEVLVGAEILYIQQRLKDL